jgi:nicotinamidase-related amidase
LRDKSMILLLIKNLPSSFYGTNIDGILRNLAVVNLVVSGVTTLCSAETTERIARHTTNRILLPLS